MFCPKCGTQLPDNSVACSSCGTTFGGAAPRTMVAGGAGDRVKAASTDALGAFKTFASDPVGGLSPAYDKLGSGKAMAVGITFGVVFALCMSLAIYRTIGQFLFPGFGGFMKILLIAVVPFVALMLAGLGVRTIFRGEGEIGTDSYIAGASLLPFGIVAILMALLGSSLNLNVIYFLGLLSISLTILMLFSGLTRIYKISERMATIAIPLMLIVTAWLSRLIYEQMAKSGMGGGFNPGPGFGQ